MSKTTKKILAAVQPLMYGTFRAEERAVREQAYVLNVYALIAFLSLSFFGHLHILEGNLLVGQLELAGAGAIALNTIGMIITRNLAMTRNFLLLIALVLLVVMLLTGGTQGTGIFWFFVFPVMAFFLAGRTQGLWWMAGLYAATISVQILATYSLIFLPYDPVTVRQLLVCLGVVTVGLYIYQGVRELAERESVEIERAKSELVTLASHQLRTPISAISWLAEIMLSGDAGKLTKEQQKHVDQIYRSNQRMAMIINDMLLVSNLNLNNLPVKPVKSDVIALISDTLKATSERLLADKKLTISTNYQQQLPKIALDPTLMQTILTNVISNALKYTPENGRITISVRTTGQKLHHASKGSLEIEVQDTGYGIPAALQEKIFTRFFRGKNVRDKDTDGTGLGLFIVKGLLDYVGGNISFNSKENAGTTFVIQLPLEGMPKLENRSDHA